MVRGIGAAVLAAGIACAQPAAQQQQPERVEVSAKDSFNGQSFAYMRLLRNVTTGMSGMTSAIRRRK